MESEDVSKLTLSGGYEGQESDIPKPFDWQGDEDFDVANSLHEIENLFNLIVDQTFYTFATDEIEVPKLDNVSFAHSVPNKSLTIIFRSSSMTSTDAESFVKIFSEVANKEICKCKVDSNSQFVNLGTPSANLTEFKLVVTVEV